jgi:hypothetical protein
LRLLLLPLTRVAKHSILLDEDFALVRGNLEVHLEAVVAGVGLGEHASRVTVLADILALVVDVAELLDPGVSQCSRSDGQRRSDGGENARHFVRMVM